MKHLTINDIQPEDRRFIVEKPDPNFSPEKNYKVINQVIKEGMEIERQMRAAQQDEIKDRVDILMTYQRHALGNGEKTFEQFMGREWMKKIYGEKLLEKIRVADSVRKLNRARGNTKFENYFLT